MLLRDALPSPLTWGLIAAGFVLFVAAEVGYKRLLAVPSLSRASKQGARAFTRELLDLRAESLTWRRVEVLVAAVAIAVLLILAVRIPGTH